MSPQDPNMMTDADAKWLFGGPVNEVELTVRNDILPRAFKRVLMDSGAAKLFQAMGMKLDELPDDSVPIAWSPDWARDTGGLENEAVFDLATVIVRQFEQRRDDDGRFEKATDRWRKTPDRVKGFIPADAGSLRWTLLPSQLMTPPDYSAMTEESIHQRTSNVVGASYAYLATPFFVPAKKGVDVVTTIPPTPTQRANLKMPTRYMMIFHDGVPLPLLTGTDEEIDAYEDGNRVMRDDSLLIGGLLAADDDLTLDPTLAFLIVAAPGSTMPGYGYKMLPIPLDIVSPATDVLWNYAALLAWETWKRPPSVPQERSRGFYRTIARSPEGEQGAYQGVRVLDYREPTREELSDAEDPRGAEETRRSLKWQHTRRGYWKPGIRYAIRDEHGKPVGPVYGPGAIEGVTFERRGRHIPRTTVRDDLPARPEEEKVYRISSTIVRRD